jgi:signal peptidase I
MFLLTFLTEPPGSWLYTFVLLAALEAPAALALQAWISLRRQGPSSRGMVLGRLALATWALFLLRAAGLLFILLIPDGTRDALAILPPLDRATAAITTLVLVWVLAYPEPNRWADLAAAGLSLIVLIGLVLELAWWPQAVAVGVPYFNGSLDDTIWVVAIAALLAGGLWQLSQRRPPGWRAGMGLLCGLLLGYAIYYLYPVARYNTAGVARWAELLVLPLAVVLLYRRAQAWNVEDAAALSPAPASATRVRPVWWQLGETFLVAGLVFFSLEFATGRFRVEGPSMQPNLYTGQYVLADKLAYRLGNPQRGDVVTVLPNLPARQEYIKRLMGLPGDTIGVRNGSLWINGGKITEPYIAEPPKYVGSWQLGPDEYFVMGDNRNDSDDSHIWGTVHRRAITGKVVFVYWPISQARPAPNYSFGIP